MLIGLQEQPVPEAASAREGVDLLERLLENRLPAFVVHNAWKDVDEAAVALTDTFEAYGFGVADTPPVAFGHVEPSPRRARIQKLLGPFWGMATGSQLAERYDTVTPLHADKLPTDDPVDFVIMNHTAEGRVQASFYEPSITLLEAYRKDRMKHGMLWDAKQSMRVMWNNYHATDLYLPGRVHKALSQGLADIDFLIPVRHTAVANPGSTIVFRGGGQKPLFHRFDSLERPRRSKVRHAELFKTGDATITS